MQTCCTTVTTTSLPWIKLCVCLWVSDSIKDPSPAPQQSVECTNRIGTGTCCLSPVCGDRQLLFQPQTMQLQLLDKSSDCSDSRCSDWEWMALMAVLTNSRPPWNNHDIWWNLWQLLQHYIFVWEKSNQISDPWMESGWVYCTNASDFWLKS